MNTCNVFTGAFSDEPGQRFLRIMQDACDTAFEDLYLHSMPQHAARYRGCLERVGAWHVSVINDELKRLRQKYPDMMNVFKTTYVAYVKSMRGSRQSTLLISMPKIESFVHSFYVHFSKHKFVRDAQYFQTPSVLERRVTCMDALRDCLCDHIGDEFVKLKHRTDDESAPRPGGASVVASSVVREGVDPEPVYKHAPPSDASTKRDDDAATKVVSHIFEDVESNDPPNSMPPTDDALSSIGPDDSVSCADFAEKQHQQLKELRRVRDVESIPEDDQLSRTSLSLSSVSITQNGPVPKKTRPSSTTSSTIPSQTRSTLKEMSAPLPQNYDAPFDEDTPSQTSRPFDTLSEASAARAKRPAQPRKSPPRSYVTSLEENSD